MNSSWVIKAVAEGRVLEDLLFKDPNTGTPIEKQSEIPFFKKQVRTLLARNEKIDPIRIFDYISNDGYLALAHVLSRGSAQWVIDEVKASGLRGRGVPVSLRG